MVFAVSAAIIRDRKILLVKRSPNSKAFPGLWAFPGGRAEPGETPEETVTREVKEETGLDFRPTKLLAKSNWEDRILMRFIGEWEGEVSIQEEEISDFGWFAYEDAAKLKLSSDYGKVLELLRKEGLI